MKPELNKIMNELAELHAKDVFPMSFHKNERGAGEYLFRAGFAAAVEEMEKIIQEVVWTAQNVLAHEIDSKNGDDDGSIFSQRRITQDFKDLKLALAKVRKVKND